MKLDMVADNNGIPRDHPLDAKPPTKAFISRLHHCLYLYPPINHRFVYREFKLRLHTGITNHMIKDSL